MGMSANTFGITRSTIGLINHEICSILSNNVAEVLIKFSPTEKKLHKGNTAGYGTFWFSSGNWEHRWDLYAH